MLNIDRWVRNVPFKGLSTPLSSASSPLPTAPPPWFNVTMRERTLEDETGPAVSGLLLSVALEVSRVVSPVVAVATGEGNTNGGFFAGAGCNLASFAVQKDV